MSRDIGQYKVSNVIGKGSFGKVYKGINKLTNEEVALKFIQKGHKKPRELKNLREENELLKKINHPNVICLKDVIETQKQIIIVTDYAGRDLSGVIQEKRRFPLEKVKEYSRQILDAMVYLNEYKIVHRDLKPQNILIKNHKIKLCDFGFAKKLSASTQFLQSMKGTPLYLAPEIVREVKYTEKVDVWSFGCIIYELFTGRTPYYANTYQKLAPLILYGNVNYPKDMPLEMKDLISSMLDRNPTNRPSWKKLKENSFFKGSEPLQEKIFNNMKEVVSLEVEEEELNAKEGDSSNEQKIQESKVIQKLDNIYEVQSFVQDFKSIQHKLSSNALDANQLKTDILFLHKVKSIIHERSSNNPLIGNELVEIVLNILNTLIQATKSPSNNAANTQPNADQNAFDDITKNETLIIGMLCLAKVQKNYQMLEKQLKIICLLTKKNFNGVQINTEIDEELTEFIAQILEKKDLPLECMRNGLITIGTLTSQAMYTVNNSFAYFQSISEDRILSKIASLYTKDPKRAVVLECLKQFIHPPKTINNAASNTMIMSKLHAPFKSMKEEIATALLKTDFISSENPFGVYEESRSTCAVYCEILLECLENSEEMRREFLKHNYWVELLKNKQLDSFLFAFNSTLINLEGKSVIPKEKIHEYTNESQQNKIINIFITEHGYFNLKNLIQTKGYNESIGKYLTSILQKIEEFLFIDPSAKEKACRELFGAMVTTADRFDARLYKMYSQIMESLTQIEKNSEAHSMGREVFKAICNLNNPFRPSLNSLSELMRLFSTSPILKPLRVEKQIQSYFYECMGEVIRQEQHQHFQIHFQESQIPKFVERFIQCCNTLIEAQEQESKGNGHHTFSANAMTMSNLIQTSSFYRQMFIQELTEEQFYQHIRYSYKVMTRVKIDPEFVNFLGIEVIGLCRKFLHSKNENLLIEVFAFISQITRDDTHKEFNPKIYDIKIIRKCPEWLREPLYSESVKEKVLHLIGNLSKKSEYFFGEFQAYGIVESIHFCLEKHYKNTKIFKNSIYAIGNISFFSEKFHKHITPMIKYFAMTFEMNDSYIRNNMISTVSNLLRFSDVYLPTLIETKMIHNILKIAKQCQEGDQTIVQALSVIKKIVNHKAFIEKFGYEDLEVIYSKRSLVGGDKYEAITRIKQCLTKAGRNIHSL